MLAFKDQKLHFPSELSAKWAKSSFHLRGTLRERNSLLYTVLLWISGVNLGQTTQHDSVD